MKKVLVLFAILAAYISLSNAQGLGFKGIGAAVGYTSVSFNSSGVSETLPGFAISAHANLGEITNQLSLFPEIQYFTTSKDFTNPDLPNTTATWKLSDFAININAHYDLTAGGSFVPYIGAGVGYNMLSSDVTVTGNITGSASSTDTRFGINILAGANFMVSPMIMVFLEPRYVLASDVNHLIVKAGVTFSLL